ncbi:chromate resistance protein ChrB domain-containing protein [Burkholderia diffusa]
MKSTMRERPKVDRVACPWTIARLIDDSHHAWCRHDAHT